MSKLAHSYKYVTLKPMCQKRSIPSLLHIKTQIVELHSHHSLKHSIPIFQRQFQSKSILSTLPKVIWEIQKRVEKSCNLHFLCEFFSDGEMGNHGFAELSEGSSMCVAARSWPRNNIELRKLSRVSLEFLEKWTKSERLNHYKSPSNIIFSHSLLCMFLVYIQILLYISITQLFTCACQIKF